MAEGKIPATAGIPVLILKEGSQRTAGAEALRANMMATITISDMLRTTYGPRGMDKMLVDTLGDITITNDGATILDKMDLQHPAGKMLVQIAKGQDDEVGDGTKTSVIFSGELLKAAENLISKEVHPTVIINGYKKALEESVKYAENIAKAVDSDNEEILRKIASTALTSKAVHGVRDHFAEIAVKAVKQIAEERNGGIYVDIDNIQIVKKHGGSLADAKLVYGVVLDKEVVHPGMPKRVDKAKIALVDAPLEVEKTEIDAEIRISDPEMVKKFIEQKENLLKEMVDKIAATGANVVICQKGIDDVAQHFLAKKGILAVRRVKRSDMEKLERATGGKIVSNIDDITLNDLGYAEAVEERKVGEDKMVFIEGTKDPKAVSIVIRGGLERMVDEAERSFRDALSVVADVLKKPKVVYGGGAFEAEVAKYIRSYATKVGGKEQLAVQAFAKALEGIISALVENAGLDPINILSELRKAHNQEDSYKYGVNVYAGKVKNMEELGVIEPLAVKVNALKAGTEAATLILRIDDVIAASRVKGPEKKGPSKEES